MARYKIPNVEAVTNNSEFINECFDSIRDGTPLLVDITAAGDSPDSYLQVTCLEYLLDAVIDSSGTESRVIPEIFDQLATINLNARFCRELLDASKNPPAVSCIPHVINAYVSTTKKGTTRFSGANGKTLPNQTAALERVQFAMRKIISTYPDLMAQRICRPSPGSTIHNNMRDHYTCIDKLLNMGHNVDFIRAEDFPDGYFNQPLCQEGGDGKERTCFDRLISSGTSVGTNYAQINNFDNCLHLLESIIQSKKYERELFTNSGMCNPIGSHTRTHAAWCLEKLIHPAHLNPRSAKLQGLLLKTYSVKINGKEVIDETSDMSPFSGTKCLSDKAGLFTRCVDELLKVSMGMREMTGGIATDNLTYILMNSPKSDNPCKQLELIDRLTSLAKIPTSNDRNLMSSILDRVLPRKDSTFNELAAVECISNVGGEKHKVSGVDYALELGSPMIYLIYEKGADEKHIIDVLGKLSESTCTSIINKKSEIPCIEKLATELLFYTVGGDFSLRGEPGINLREGSKDIINLLLDRGASSLKKVVYPEGKPYLTDYLTWSVYNSTKTISPAYMGDAVLLLATTIDKMGKSKIIFEENANGTRLGMILDIFDRVKQTFNITSPLRQTLYDKFKWSDDNVMKAVSLDNFWAADAGDKPSNSIYILSKWYSKYKGVPIGDRILSRVGSGISAISEDSEIDENGLERCQGERTRLEESCEEDCFNSCHDAENYDSGDALDDMVEKRLGNIVKKELGKYIQLSDKEKWDRTQIIQAAHADRVRSNVIDILIEGCENACHESCSDYVAETFNCREYLRNEGYFKTKISDGILPEFRNVYQKLTSSRKTDPDVEQLFFDVYGKTMEDKFKPSLESRIEFDDQCYNKGSSSRSGRKSAPGLDFVYNDVPKASKLKPDDLGIVGVYDITDGKTGEWSSDHLWKYADAMRKVIWGSEEVIGEPYIHVRESDKWKPVPVGLINAIDIMTKTSPLETIGERKNNVRGRLVMLVEPSGFYAPLDDSQIEKNIKLLRNTGGDFKITLVYVDEHGKAIPDQVITYNTPEGQRERIVPTKTTFKLMDAIKKMPTKLKKQLQANYPVLFSQLSTVIRMEEEFPEEEPESKIKRYKMVISNKPTDIVRCSACQAWDVDSCISIFGGFHNNCLQCYIRGGSYIAYLTTASEYEPQWRARLFMHKCKNGDSVAIQRLNRHYDMTIKSGSQGYPNWEILFKAVKIVLADKGVNSISEKADCQHAWMTGAKDEAGKEMDRFCGGYDSGGYADYHMIDPLKVGNREYKGILEETTGQIEDSSKFVKQVKTEF